MDNLYYGKQLWDYEDVNFLIDEFMELYEKRPIKNNGGGVCRQHIYFGRGMLLKN